MAQLYWCMTHLLSFADCHFSCYHFLIPAKTNAYKTSTEVQMNRKMKQYKGKGIMIKKVMKLLVLF